MKLLLSILYLTAALACVMGSPRSRRATAAEKTAEANTEFALDLYNALGSPGTKNTFFSPYSISTAFGMVLAGAGGRTATQIATTFHFDYISLDPNDIHPIYKNFIQEFNSGNKNFTLSTANKLFLQSGFEILPQYQNTLTQNYLASVDVLDFQTNPDAAAANISTWVESQTHGKIKELFPKGSLQSDTKLVLANAIYFKGTWKTEFVKSDTRREDFKLSNSQTIPVDMMKVTSDFLIGYSPEHHAKILRMPYSGDELSMIVILPDAVDGLPALVNSLTPTVLSSFKSSLRQRKVSVKFPKFKMEIELDLKALLVQMGIVDAFSNLANLFEENLKVDQALHRAVIETDEIGTVAAAVTVVHMVPYSLAIPQELNYEFHADHPFLFGIIHDRTGLPLFWGSFTGTSTAIAPPRPPPLRPLGRPTQFPQRTRTWINQPKDPKRRRPRTSTTTTTPRYPPTRPTRRPTRMPPTNLPYFYTVQNLVRRAFQDAGVLPKRIFNPIFNR